MMGAWMCAAVAAATTSSSVAGGCPYAMLYRMVSLKRTVSWGTTASARRRDVGVTVSMSWASREMVPDVGG